MKKILFVVNTMGRAGAETALLELMRILDDPEYEVSLYVILAQGEMIGQLPPHVKLMNQRVSSRSVMTGRGKLAMAGTICSAFFRNGGYLGKIHCIIRNFAEMRKAGKLQMDKLLWRMLSDGAVRTEEVFDLAVAYLEGASAYYVADHVKQCHLVSSLESPRHLTCEVIISMIYGRFLTLSDKMIQLEYFRV